MFGLDTIVAGWIVAKCAALGGAFGFGALEGAIMYLSVGVLGYFKVKEGSNK